MTTMTTMTECLSETIDQRTTVDIGRYFADRAALVDRWMDRLIPPVTESPSIIHEAMRYSLFAGGKRLRPVLAMAAAELFDVAEESLLPVASSLEMIHTYSLIHDDLPAMDDDDLRRGMPTCHVRYGEAIAILAGDALLTRAFQTLVEAPISTPEIRIALIAEVARAAGTSGALIGGQVLDLLSEGQPVTATLLEDIHRAKTGALIRCAVRTGALLGRADGSQLDLLTTYGEKIGLAFQIADDLLDETATTAQLGKTAGKDVAAHKATYTALHGIEGARHLARRVTAEAISALDLFDSLDSSASLPGDTSTLRAIARFIVERES